MNHCLLNWCGHVEVKSSLYAWGGDSNIMRNSSEKNIMRSLMKDGLSSLMQ
jgi:hypothetical protein